MYVMCDVCVRKSPLEQMRVVLQHIIFSEYCKFYKKYCLWLRLSAFKNDIGPLT